MKRKYTGISLFFIAALIFGLIFSRPKLFEGKKTAAEQSIMVPTVFVHGYKGSDRSFSTMFKRMDEYKWGQKTLVCRVDNQGHIQFRGSLPKRVANPFIQVIFQNNRATLADQTQWLKSIMGELRARYGVREMNLVGHSMGGLALTNFLETAGDNGQYPRALKLITIGSPFKGIDREDYFEHNYGEALIDLKPASQALELLMQNRGAFPKEVPVLSIAGVVTDPQAGDGLVSLHSAHGNRDIIDPSQFTELIVEEPEATHFGLHEHPMVDKLIGEFLWGVSLPEK